jgi:hypothetical protein
MTGSPERATSFFQMPAKSHFAALVELDDAARQHQREGRGVDEQRIRFVEMARPVAAADLVADQPVGGRGVRHAQQRFREAHQHHALFARQRIFLGEGIDAAALVARGADALHEFARERLGARALAGRQARLARSGPR